MPNSLFTIRTHVYRPLHHQVSRRYGSAVGAELRKDLDGAERPGGKSGALSVRVGTDSAPCRTSPATQACDWVVSDSPCLVGPVLPDGPTLWAGPFGPAWARPKGRALRQT